MNAIDIIRKSIKTHEDWAIYFETSPLEAELPEHKNIGPSTFHRGVIKEYEEAIAEIEQLQARLTIANKQILEYEQTEAAVCPEGVGIERYVKSLTAQLATAKEENDRLKEFARPVIKHHCWNIFDMDGADIQELAEKLELIVPHMATEEDIDDESDFEVGDPIFKFSETLKGEQPCP